jgi:hypothetical protein
MVRSLDRSNLLESSREIANFPCPFPLDDAQNSHNDSSKGSHNDSHDDNAKGSHNDSHDDNAKNSHNIENSFNKDDHHTDDHHATIDVPIDVPVDINQYVTIFFLTPSLCLSNTSPPATKDCSTSLPSLLARTPSLRTVH